MTFFDDLSQVRLEGDVLRIAIATDANGTSLDFDGVAQGTHALRALSAGTIAARSVSRALRSLSLPPVYAGDERSDISS